MLLRKLLRTAWRYRSQFISMILMVAIGMGVFLGFSMEWVSLEADTQRYFAETNYADYRLYSDTGFSRADVEKLQGVPGIRAATRFLNIQAAYGDTHKSLAVLVSEDYNVSTMHIVSGAAYDPDSMGLWLSDRFAEQNGIDIGDEITLKYQGLSVTAPVVGLCKAGEMMICTADSNQLMPDFATFGFAYITPRKLESALGGAFYPQVNLLSDLSKEAVEQAVADALDRTIMVTPKADHTSYAGAQSEILEGKSMAAVLPVLFLAIGVLTMVTTMHRIAANEKTQIGTLKALGFRDRRILRHYTAYGLFIGLVGVGLAVLLGWGMNAAILAPEGMMGTYFDLPEWDLVMPGYCIPVLAASVVFLTAISYCSVKRMLRGTAADALRPYTPKPVKSGLLERLPLWEKLPFGARWNLRDVLRHKARSAMTLIGVIGCMLLLVGALGMQDTMDDFLALMGRDICNYRTRVDLVETADNAEALALAEALEGDWSAAAGVSFEGRTVMLEIFSVDHDRYRLLDEDNQILPLTDEGVYLCLRLKDTAAVGDTVTLSPYGSRERYEVRTAGHQRSMMTENIVMSAKYAEKIGLPFQIRSIYTDLGRDQVPDSGIIATVQEKQTVLDTYDSFMQILYLFVLVLCLAAVALGMVVLYNLGVMSYMERSRELATLKVLGFRDRQIGRLLISQNVWLTVLGVILGLPGGVGVLQLILLALGSEYELSLALGPLTYIGSILVTFGMSVLVGWMVARKSRKINMVEALKNGE